MRVHQALQEEGYGLLIHDAYRPWYVTKMFWEGTPPALRDFVADPEEGSRLALEVAYSLARARVVMAKGGADGLDAGALRAEVERAMVAMEDVRRIKSQLTSAANQIEDVRAIVEGMAERVRGHLAQIDEIVAAAADE